MTPSFITRCAATAALILLTTAQMTAQLPASTLTLSNGEHTIEVNSYGVIVNHPGMTTFDGKQVTLSPFSAEWGRILFDTSAGHAEYCVAGLDPDWSNGVMATPISLTLVGDTIVAVVGAGPAQVTTRVRFDPEGPYVLVQVSVTNQGTEELVGLFVSREFENPGVSGSFPTDFPFPMPILGVDRRLWMLDNLPPGQTSAVGYSYLLPQAGGLAEAISTAVATVDVPLTIFTNAQFPNGLVFGSTNGVSWGDYDYDGYPDVYAQESRNLWRNVHGQNMILVANLQYALPSPPALNYGSSFGDYNNDGIPDIGTEPRSDCMNLLMGQGDGPNFTNVANVPSITTGQPCAAPSETICWGDVDFDNDLDLFLPVYPAAAGGPGNFFMRNNGPIGAGGEYTLTENSAGAGLDNPPNTARPEGAQFVDVDFDGDMDLYSNGTLYRNNSTPSTPSFSAMTGTASGIGNVNDLEEGAVFGDYDLDGDFDLFIVYSSAAPGARIWECEGDGTFFAAATTIVQSPGIGLDLGMSAEDWDMDGDIDFTTRQVFRRNQLMETGNRLFTVATHSIPAGHLTSATPAWADWDKDGDLDCALGNWLDMGHFYVNTTYNASTPMSDRRYFRIRPLRDSTTVPAGLETEYATTVELFVAGEEGVRRRRKFTSSSNGYLNQNEYTLTFALPDDPEPTDPFIDTTFDAVLDFPNNPALGLYRVDRHVNPLLGGLSLGTVPEREAIVFRSGRVKIGTCDVTPSPMESPTLTTTAGGLRFATPTATIPSPTMAPSPDYWVGLDVSVGATPIRVTEIILDGQLDAAVAAATPFNIALWDVTVPATPVMVQEGLLARTTSIRNQRTAFRTNVILQPSRNYRWVARVTQIRNTTITGPLSVNGLTTSGGLAFQDAAPTTGAAVAAATVNATQIQMAMRYRAALVGQPSDLGNGYSGAVGLVPPTLSVTGNFQPSTNVTVNVTGAEPNAQLFGVVGFGLECRDIFGKDALLPSYPIVIGPIPALANGTFSLTTFWPGGFTSGTNLFMQFWAFGPIGIASTNCISVTIP